MRGFWLLINQFIRQVELLAAYQVSSSLDYTAKLLYFMKSLTSDNDLMVSLCDASLCFGFIFYDNDRVARFKWAHEANAAKCPAAASDFTGNAVGHTFSSRREMRFEIRSDRTVGFASSGDPYPYAHAFDGQLKPRTGLWLQVCRDSASEDYEFGHIEFSLKTNKA